MKPKVVKPKANSACHSWCASVMKDEGEHTAIIKIVFLYLVNITGTFVISFVSYYHYDYDTTFSVVVTLVTFLTLAAFGCHFIWRGNIIEYVKWFIAPTLALIVFPMGSLPANGILWQTYGQISLPTVAYNISVSDIQNYANTTNKFIFMDGDILINATQCFHVSGKYSRDYALAPLVANWQNFSQEMIPAFVLQPYLDNSHCDLPHNINWLQPIHQAILADEDGIDAIPLIYTYLNMTFDKQALNAPILYWGYVNTFVNDAKAQAFLCLWVTLAVPSGVFVVSSFYYGLTKLNRYEKLPTKAPVKNQLGNYKLKNKLAQNKK